MVRVASAGVAASGSGSGGGTGSGAKRGETSDEGSAVFRPLEGAEPGAPAAGSTPGPDPRPLPLPLTPMSVPSTVRGGVGKR